ncbi:MAG: 2Fe-2S iron-sulfur cluster-binding protein [Thermoguttaceae bacterium]
MAIVLIDGQQLEIRDGERLNGIQAAARLGIEIPHYCWHPALSVVGSCRMCLVEMGMRDPKTGQITMFPKLAPACNTPMRDGLVLVTNSQKVREARARVEEALLLRHPIDCPICDKAGECRLQDYHFQYGQTERRADLRPVTSRRRDLGERITLFVDRCILCTRCVRFAREIAGTGELLVADRGVREEIEVLPGFPLANRLSGNVVDLCPVGALADKEFLYRQRVWFLRQHAGVCTGCATGCSTWIEENQDRIYRVRPRENPQVNGWWICDDGRYDYAHVHSERRVSRPLRRQGASVGEVDWTRLPEELDRRLREAGSLGAVFSPFLTVEEAYLLARYIRQIDPEAALALGPVPVAGQDERFPGGFTISAEKCPNRRGVEEVVAHFAGRLMDLEELIERIGQRPVRALWITGGYKSDWIDPQTAAALAAVELLVVQDLFPSAVSERAGYLLPAAAFAERDGSYVSRAAQLQSVRRAIRPPAGVWPEGDLFWALLGRPGLYDARAVLTELAAEIIYFHVARGPIPELGINLKINLLAQGKSEGIMSLG